MTLPRKSRKWAKSEIVAIKRTQQLADRIADRAMKDLMREGTPKDHMFRAIEILRDDIDQSVVPHTLKLDLLKRLNSILSWKPLIRGEWPK